MTTLQAAFDRIRSQTDLDDEDLPDEVLTDFLREAFDRTMGVTQRWPFLEATWSLTKQDGETTVQVPTDLAQPLRLTRSDGGIVVMYDHALLEETYQMETSSGDVLFFSRWGDQFYLWPEPDAAGTASFTMRGFRKPRWSDDPAVELDGDERLHPSIIHYATALAYAKQEDPDLEAVYMQRWASGVQLFRQNLMKPMHDQPMILNGGLPLRMRPGSIRWAML